MDPVISRMLDLWATASAQQLSQVISQAIAPVFLLSAVASFINLLASRLARVEDRIRTLNRIPDDDSGHLWLKADILRLKKRKILLHRAMYRCLCAGLSTTTIVIFMFGSAFLGFQHHWGSALLFLISLLLFASALLAFTRELWIAHSDADDHGVS